jgi:general secretion pathway protein G
MKKWMSAMRTYSGDQKGFTLIEIMIVIVILGILVSVVIPNVVGLIGRGAASAFGADNEAIQHSVSAFYCDLHSGYDAANDVWLDVNGAENAGHYYPTALGNSAEHYLTLLPEVVDGSGNPLVYDGVDRAPAEESDISKHAIWMGLLVNNPGEYSPVEGGVDGTTLSERGDAVSPLEQENGPYLNNMPRSASAYNGSSNTGQYTWVVSNNGAVIAVYELKNYDPPGPTGIGNYWFAGFNGSYP